MRRSQLQLEASTSPKWFNSPVKSYKGTLTEIRANLPEFERRSLALTQPGSQRSRLNERLDIVIRKPFGVDPDFIPIGVVSKEYVLVPHADVLDVAIQALKKADIASDSVKAQLTLSQYGERMSFGVCLPGNYSYDPGDGNPLALRLECFNSVDGSTRFRALMGWFRFVCRNGLILGVTSHDLRRRHVGDLALDDLGDVLASGIQESEREKENFKCWLQFQIHLKTLVPWVEKDLREM
jgi:hypothetical protein